MELGWGPGVGLFGRQHPDALTSYARREAAGFRGSKAGESLAVAAVPFVGLFAALKIISNVSQVQQNLLKKEVQSTTLSPGTSAHGFLYIPVPKDAPREKIHLRVPITRTGADEAFVLDLVF